MTPEQMKMECLACGWIGHEFELFKEQYCPEYEHIIPGEMRDVCPMCKSPAFETIGPPKTPMQTIREHQGELEQELESKLVDVDGIVAAFVKETGVPISGIRIEFIETTTIGSQPEYHMCGVRVEYGP